LTGAGLEVVGWCGPAREIGEFRPVDLADRGATGRALNEADPAGVVHLAAISTVEGVRRDPQRARAVNVEATALIANWCDRRGRRMVYASTDLVFDGTRAFSAENDPAEPALAYGRTKRDAEAAVRAVPGGLVARISLLFGPSLGDRPTYLDRTVEGLRAGVPQTCFEDEYRTPLDFATAAEALAQLLEVGAVGLVHVGGRERLSRFELARRVAVSLGLDAGLVLANRRCDVSAAEPRPADVSLDTSLLAELLPALDRPVAERAVVRLWEA
jgi:dTDP-4-dehydrorhamnose reductase